MLAITPACSSTVLPIAGISLIRDYLPITALHALPPCSALRSMASLVSSGTAGNGSARLCVLLGSLFGHGVHFPALLSVRCVCSAAALHADQQHAPSTGDGALLGKCWCHPRGLESPFFMHGNVHLLPWH